VSEAVRQGFVSEADDFVLNFFLNGNQYEARVIFFVKRPIKEYTLQNQSLSPNCVESIPKAQK
jgi:hypothetical protein